MHRLLLECPFDRYHIVTTKKLPQFSGGAHHAVNLGAGKTRKLPGGRREEELPEVE